MGEALFAAAMAMAGLTGAAAQEAPVDGFGEIETKYIFGFTRGSDIGLEGERELSIESQARLGKRAGSFNAFQHKLEYEFTPTQFTQFEFGVLGSTHRIRGVPGMDDRNATAFVGLSGALRYLLIGRGPASPFGLTLEIEPEWARIDDTGGERVRKFETEFKLHLDTELVTNRVYLAFNALYEPEVVRAVGAPETEFESKLGFSAALAARLTPQIVLGAELGYFRAYEGLAFRTFEGQALYLGPTLYLQLTRKAFIAAAWSTQVAGRSVDDRRSLDLDHFDRHRARLQVAVEF